MEGSKALQVVLGAGLVLLFVAACALLFFVGREVLGPGVLAPTATGLRPTLVLPTETPGPTATPTPVASATATEQASPTAPVLLSPTPTVSPTQPPATATPQPTASRVPPTRTPAPTATQTRPPATSTATATFTPLPTVVITEWRGEYYASTSLTPPSKVVRNDQAIDFTYAAGVPPAAGLPAQNWSARWTRELDLKEGSYRFRLLVDDGARLWVGDRLLIDAWYDGAARELTADRTLKGEVPIRLEFYNHLGLARVRLTWERVTQFTGWLGNYYDRPEPSGMPYFQRGDAEIKFDWGTGAPRWDLPTDNFSVRWTRRVSLAETGLYRFHTVSDDGVRLWVDGKLLVDVWSDGRWTQDTSVSLTAGEHDLQVDYYEHLGGARIEVSWEMVPVTPTRTPTATPTSTRTPIALETQPVPTKTPAPTSTRTPISIETQPVPTDTPLPPTATPPPVRPEISLDPQVGPIGAPFNLLGHGWPPNTPVDLFLVRSLPGQEPTTPEAQVTSDETGSFEATVAIPPGQGWEGLPAAKVMARTADERYRAQAVYRLLPELKKVEYKPMPTGEERFALSEPTYLALDSADAWSSWFGSAPPPVEPPIDWQREIVLAAFLGTLSDKKELAVVSIVERDNTVSAWLNAAVAEGREVTEGKQVLPRTMVRVSRRSLPATAKAASPGLVFTFLDASGRVLAQGSMGELQPPAAIAAAAAKALQAPAPLPALPKATEMAVAPATDIAPPPAATESVGAAEPTGALAQAAAAPEVAAEAAPAPAQPDRPRPSAGTLAAVGMGAFLLVGWGVAVAVNRRVSRRR
jgi:hypothetical protein